MTASPDVKDSVGVVLHTATKGGGDMTEWRDAPMLAVDFETTGPDPMIDRIVTACAATIKGSDVTVRTWLLDPETDIPEGATAVHGITTAEALEHGQDYASGVSEIAGALSEAWENGCVIVGYNVSFDLTMLYREYQRVRGAQFTVGGIVLDPYVMDKAIDPYRKGSRKLVDVSAFHGFRLDDAHNAEADALAAARLAYKIGRHPTLDDVDVMVWQANRYEQQQTRLADYRRAQGFDVSDINTEWPVRGYHA